jgi:hypothetical protein
MVVRDIKSKHFDHTIGRTAWLLFTGLTYLLALAAIILLVSRTLTWGQHTLDDLRYGYPRINSTTGYAFKGDSSERPTLTLALNLHGQVQVLVFPASDIERMYRLEGPYLFGDSGKEVPNIEMRDVNQDNMQDLILTVMGEAVVYLNQDGNFRLITPHEREMLMKNEQSFTLMSDL